LKISLVFILLLLLANQAQGQLLSNPEGLHFQAAPKFEASFIKANSIEKIVIEDELKPDGQRIKKTGAKMIVFFMLG